MNELRLQLTEKEKEFLSQYAQVYDDERKRDGTRDPIVLVQTKTEVLAPEGAEDLCKYSLHIDGHPYSEEELLDEKIEVLTALKDGKPPDQIPNYYSVLENFSPDQHWD